MVYVRQIVRQIARLTGLRGLICPRFISYNTVFYFFPDQNVQVFGLQIFFQRADCQKYSIRIGGILIENVLHQFSVKNSNKV